MSREVSHRSLFLCITSPSFVNRSRRAACMGNSGSSGEESGGELGAFGDWKWERENWMNKLRTTGSSRGMNA